MHDDTSLKGLILKYRLLTVLIILLLYLIFSTIIQLAGLGHSWSVIAFLIVILAAANTMRDRTAFPRSTLIFALVVTLPWMAQLIVDAEFVEITATLLGTSLLAYTTFVILRRILTATASHFDLICGSIAAYFLIATTWAGTFQLIEMFAPGSFSGLSIEQVDRWNQWIYFSLTTLTTLGYGDISPVNPLARLWASVEAAFGVLYVAILVARLVAVYRSDTEATSLDT